MSLLGRIHKCVSGFGSRSQSELQGPFLQNINIGCPEPSLTLNSCWLILKHNNICLDVAMVTTAHIILHLISESPFFH